MVKATTGTHGRPLATARDGAVTILAEVREQLGDQRRLAVTGGVRERGGEQAGGQNQTGRRGPREEGAQRTHGRGRREKGKRDP